MSGAWQGRAASYYASGLVLFAVPPSSHPRSGLICVAQALLAGCTSNTPEAMKAALAAANKPAEFKIYLATPHGFHAGYRRALDPSAE
jgi:dienelactone hydrolase